MINCVVHDTIDPSKIKAFESFAAAGIRLVDHHGYFTPSEGASDGALALRYERSFLGADK